MTTRFVEVDDMKVRLRVTHSNDDDYIDSLIQAHTAVIQNWVGRTIVSTTFSETHDVGFRQVAVFLKEYPIISIAGCTSHSTAMVEDTDYYADYNTGVLKKAPVDAISVLDYQKDYWYEGLSEFSITYTAGYATIPIAIQEATIKLVQREYWDIGAGDVKIRRQGTDHIERFPMKDGVPENVFALLHPYRRQFQ